jgi:hypothetical protein
MRIPATISEAAAWRSMLSMEMRQFLPDATAAAVHAAA